MKKLFALIKIIRPVNFAITFASVFVAGLICQENKEITLSILLAAISASLVSGGGNVINDYFDIEIDKINRPYRVLPSGALNKTAAFMFYLFLSAAALLIAWQINKAAFAVVVVAIASVFIYSFKFKSVPLFGNFIVAFFTGFAFIYGGIAVDNWKNGIFPALFAFFINFVREVTKDIEDMKGDRAHGVRTFPIVYGVEKAKKLTAALSAILIILTFVPFYLSIYNIEYFIVVLLTVDLLLVYLLKKIWLAGSAPEYHRTSSLLKTAMAFGLIAIYIGTL